MKKRIFMVMIVFLLLFSALVVKLGYITFIVKIKSTMVEVGVWKWVLPVKVVGG
ncbi:MAG: hypothetical protein K2I88_05210 [Anaeroplasmataceae bacterium]|nr:hypothetical protein [Anaeroplasmataceae bacterium]